MAECEQPLSDKSNIRPPDHLNQIENGLDLSQENECLAVKPITKDDLSKCLKYVHDNFLLGWR